MKSNTTTVSLTSAQFRRAAELKDSIETSQNELTALLMGQSVTKTAKSSAKPATGGKRVMTPEQRAKIAAGQKARWAARNAASPATTPAQAPVSNAS